MNEPKTNDKHFRDKWRQLHFLIGVQRSRCKDGILCMDSATADHVYVLCVHEAMIHAAPFYGEAQTEQFRKRYNDVLDYFAPEHNTITRDNLPLRRA